MLQAFEQNPSGEGLNVTIKYDDAQIEWFKNEALNVEEGWTIFVFSHVVVYGNDYTKQFSVPTTFPGYEAIYDAIADYDGNGEIAAVLQGHFHWDASMYIDKRSALELELGSPEDASDTAKAYAAVPNGAKSIYVNPSVAGGLSYRVVGYSLDEIVYDSGTNKEAEKIILDDTSLKYVVIFSADDGRELTENDLLNNKVYEITGQIPLVVTASDRYYAENPPPFDQEDRVCGTITEQAFDVVILDKIEKKLYFVRIGAPAKVGDESVEVREFYYG